MTGKEKFNRLISSVEEHIYAADVFTFKRDIIDRVVEDMCPEDEGTLDRVIRFFFNDMTLDQYVVYRRAMAAYKYIIENGEKYHAKDVWTKDKAIVLSGRANLDGLDKLFKLMNLPTPEDAAMKKDMSKYIPPTYYEQLSYTDASMVDEKFEKKKPLLYGMDLDAVERVKRFEELREHFGLEPYQAQIGFELSEKYGILAKTAFGYVKNYFENIEDAEGILEHVNAGQNEIKEHILSRSKILEICLEQGIRPYTAYLNLRTDKYRSDNHCDPVTMQDVKDVIIPEESLTQKNGAFFPKFIEYEKSNFDESFRDYIDKYSADVDFRDAYDSVGKGMKYATFQNLFAKFKKYGCKAGVSFKVFAKYYDDYHSVPRQIKISDYFDALKIFFSKEYDINFDEFLDIYPDYLEYEKSLSIQEYKELKACPSIVKRQFDSLTGLLECYSEYCAVAVKDDCSLEIFAKNLRQFIKLKGGSLVSGYQFRAHYKEYLSLECTEDYCQYCNLLMHNKWITSCFYLFKLYKGICNPALGDFINVFDDFREITYLFGSAIPYTDLLEKYLVSNIEKQTKTVSLKDFFSFVLNEFGFSSKAVLDYYQYYQNHEGTSDIVSFTRKILFLMLYAQSLMLRETFEDDFRAPYYWETVLPTLTLSKDNNSDYESCVTVTLSYCCNELSGETKGISYIMDANAFPQGLLYDNLIINVNSPSARTDISCLETAIAIFEDIKKCDYSAIYDSFPFLSVTFPILANATSTNSLNTSREVFEGFINNGMIVIKKLIKVQQEIKASNDIVLESFNCDDGWYVPEGEANYFNEMHGLIYDPRVDVFSDY